jgi:hypothetical protein
MAKVNAAALVAQAHAAGIQALEDSKPVPMIVGHSKTLFGNDVDPNQPRYFVESGVCGFASIRVKPGNCAVAKYLREVGLGRRSDYGGILVSVREGGQSLQRKEAYGYAFARVLQAHGVDAYCESRMD